MCLFSPFWQPLNGKKVVEYSSLLYLLHWQVHIEEPADVFFNRGVAPPTGFFGIAEMKQLVVLEQALKSRLSDAMMTSEGIRDYEFSDLSNKSI